MNDLLAADVGNSATKVGFFAGARLRLALTFPTADASPAAICERLSREARRKGRHLARVSDLALCTVVPKAKVLWQRVARLLGAQILTMTGETPGPLKNEYHDPAALGPDRLAAAVGAAKVFGAPVIVVNLGTATTVDAVSAEGRFLGGAICLGIDSALGALSSVASLLPTISPSRARAAIGRDTRQSILAGSYYGTIGQVNEIVARQRAALGENATVVATGGLARLVAKHIQGPAMVRRNLTLHGIRLIWEYNRACPRPLP